MYSFKLAITFTNHYHYYIDYLSGRKESIMAKHLTLSDRIIIERGINNELTFATIARMLDRSPSSISREVKRYRVIIQSNHSLGNNDCTKRMSCLRNKICADAPVHGCFLTRCKSCTDINCNDICPVYESPHCVKLNKPPYVCVGCEQQKNCQKNHAYYAAHRADTAHHRTVREAHSGIRMNPEELVALGQLIEPLIKKGQSLNHICVTHAAEIGVSEKTLYNYIEAHPELPVTEMDTVKGKRSGSGKVLLTMILTPTNFMPIFLMPNCTESSVLNVFDYLTDLLGLETFRKLFPVILTDNGVEFKNPESLEYTRNGCPRTKIFYCDPQASWQKPHVEKNHTFIRRIIPRHTDLNGFSNHQIHLLTRHINSYFREEYGNRTPFEMVVTKEQKKLLSSLELTPIPPDEVLLKPTLMKQ